jgi:hypothetical protein
MYERTGLHLWHVMPGAPVIVSGSAAKKRVASPTANEIDALISLQVRGHAPGDDATPDGLQTLCENKNGPPKLSFRSGTVNQNPPRLMPLTSMRNENPR